MENADESFEILIRILMLAREDLQIRSLITDFNDF